MSEVNMDSSYQELPGVLSLDVFVLSRLPDDAFINPQLAKIFDRVRQSADFMPIKQMTVSPSVFFFSTSTSVKSQKLN